MNESDPGSNVHYLGSSENKAWILEKPWDARLVSRVFAAPRSQSLTKTRHVTSDAIQEVQWLSRLSDHIYLHGKDLFLNLWIDASPIWNEMYLKEKRILSKTIIFGQFPSVCMILINQYD